MDIQNSFYYVLYIFFQYYYRLLVALGLYEYPKPQITLTMQCDEYVDKQKQKFLASYDSSTTYNDSIDPVFYDHKKYKQVVSDVNNALEPYWTRRILFENTPRGNIVMYYDAYKRGFVYYCDNSSIPYPLINAVVMKYVLLYHCRDFFVDTQIIPKEHPSPFSNEAPEKEEDEPATKKTRQSNAFAKLKTYSEVSAKTDEPVLRMNTIIYNGKMCNFSFLQKITPPKTVSVNPDFKAVLSYSEYKKLQSIHESASI
jgi:hypothetical protein